MSDTRDVLLRVGAQFAGWKGADMKPLHMQAKAAAEAVQNLKEQFEKAGIASNNAGRMGGKMMQEMGNAQKAGLANPFSKFDLSSVSRFDAGLKQLARSNMEVALATQKAIDAERQRRSEMTQSLLVQEQLAKRGLGGGPDSGGSPFGMGARFLGGMASMGRFASPLLGPIAGMGALAGEIPEMMNVRAGREFDPERAGPIGRAYGWSGRTLNNAWGSATGFRNRYKEVEGSQEEAENNAKRLDEKEKNVYSARRNWANRSGIYRDAEDESWDNESQSKRLGTAGRFDVSATAGRYRDRSRLESEGFAGLAADRAATPTMNLVPGAASSLRVEQEQARMRADQVSTMGISEARELALAKQDRSRSGDRVDLIRGRLARLDMGPAARESTLKRANETYVDAANRRSLADQKYDKAVDSGGDVTGAAAARQRAVMQEMEAQKELESVQRSINDRANERIRLNEQLASATKAMVGDEARIAEATRASAAAEREKLQVQKDYHGQQKNKYQGVAEGEREKQKDLAVSYLTMDPLQRFQTASIAKKLAAAKEGKLQAGPAQVRWVNGRPQRIAGTGGGLTHEEMQMASSNPFLRNQFRDYASQATQQDPILKQIMEFEGTKGREREANDRAEFHAKAENSFKVQIENDEKAIIDQLNEKLYPGIVDAMNKSNQELMASVESKMAQMRDAMRTGSG